MSTSISLTNVKVSIIYFGKKLVPKFRYFLNTESGEDHVVKKSMTLSFLAVSRGLG